MARTIYRAEDQSVDLTSYVGPVRDDGGPRQRFQVTVVSAWDGQMHSASLSAEQFRDLVKSVAECMPFAARLGIERGEVSQND